MIDTPDRWGPFAPNIETHERVARCRCLSAIVYLTTGSRGVEAERLLRIAEQDPDALWQAAQAFNALPATSKRNVWASYAAVTRPSREDPMAETTPAPTPEVEADQVEAAMRTLAFEGAKRGGRRTAATIKISDGPRPSQIQAIVADPIGTALAGMEMQLSIYLAQTCGPDRATLARDRVNAAIYETFERPQIEARGPRQ